MRAGEAFARLPPWARWLSVYAATLGACWVVGSRTPLEVGGALFLAGALAVFAAAFWLRTGGPRMVVTARAPDGRALRREPLPAQERAREIRRGVAAFLLALALWAPVAARAWLP